MTNVLIVDDEDSNLSVISEAVEIVDGCKAITAKDGKEALEKLVEPGNISLIITDYMMPPGMDGYELVKKLREDEKYKSIPVIGSSGTPSDEFKQIVDVFMKKPYELIDIIETVKRLIK